MNIHMLLGFLLCLVVFTGYNLAAYRTLRIPAEFAPIFTVSSLGIILYFATLLQIQIYINEAGFILGLILCFGYLIESAVRNFSQLKQFFARYYIYIILLAIIFLYVQHMFLNVLDEYSYWGVIGKYLYFTHHLPTRYSGLDAGHLSYTPGMAIWHNFIYQIFHQYSDSIAYFAQDIMIISGIYVVFDARKQISSLFMLLLVLIMATIFFGTMFANLLTASVLATYIFAILWIYHNEQYSDKIKLLIISTPIIFLFLIKQIGIFFGVALLIYILLDMLYLQKNNKRLVLLWFFSTTGLLIITKLTWWHHWRALKFAPFIGHVALSKIIHGFNIIGNIGARKGAILFIKSITIGHAIGLPIPYLVFYFIAIFLMYFLYKKATQDVRLKLRNLYVFFGIVFFIYLFLLYVLQVVVFKVGINFQHVLSMRRYLNYYFAAMILFIFALYCENYLLYTRFCCKKYLLIFVIVTITLLGFGRIQRLRHNGSPQMIQVRKIVIHTLANKKIPQRICVIQKTKYLEDNYRIAYALLPHTTNYTAFPVQNNQVFMRALTSCDYMIVLRQDDVIKARLDKLGLHNAADGLYAVNLQHAKPSLKLLVNFPHV